MKTLFKSTLFTVAVAAMTLPAVPAAAVELPVAYGAHAAAPAADIQFNRYDRDDRYDRYDRYDRRDRRGYGRERSRYDERVHRNTRVWRGRDGRYYCQKENGTTGLLIGAAVGGLIGNEVAGRGDKTIGAILGAVGGAFLGREIDRSDARCR